MEPSKNRQTTRTTPNRFITSVKNVCIVFISVFIISNRNLIVRASQDPTTFNGGSAMAMAGDECVALAVDKRFGCGPQTVNIAPRKVLTPHSHLMVAFTGLEGDIFTISQELSLHISEKFSSGLGFGFSNDDNDPSTLKSRNKITPRAMSSLTSHLLYSRRNSPFYCEPLIIGLEKTVIPSSSSSRAAYRPFICAQDLIGAKSYARDFACSGVAEKSLYGTAEAMWRPGLTPQELVRVCGRAFLSGLERDCLSGYGAVVYLMTKDGGIWEFELDCRND